MLTYKFNLPLIGFISPIEWCDEALELGVVDTADMGEPGFMSLGVVFPQFPPDDVLPSDFICELVSDDELLVTFCWASRSCLRNLALRFWNQTWKIEPNQNVNRIRFFGDCFNEQSGDLFHSILFIVTLFKTLGWLNQLEFSPKQMLIQKTSIPIKRISAHFLLHRFSHAHTPWGAPNKTHNSSSNGIRYVV